jgi:hypothetical protein
MGQTPHVRFEVAESGNGADRPPRHSSTLPEKIRSEQSSTDVVDSIVKSILRPCTGLRIESYLDP